MTASGIRITPRRWPRCGIHKTLRKGTRLDVASFPQLSFCACPPLSGQCMLCDSGSRDAGQTGVRQVRQKTAQYEIHISEDISRRRDEQAQGASWPEIPGRHRDSGESEYSGGLKDKGKVSYWNCFLHAGVGAASVALTFKRRWPCPVHGRHRRNLSYGLSRRPVAALGGDDFGLGGIQTE